MEPSKEAIAVRITRLNRQILGKVTSGSNKLNKKTIDREALLDALTVLYDECNDDPVKKSDELVRAFVDKYRSTLAELRRTRVCLSDFEIVQTIGRGHFGEVHMVREKETSDVYALKILRKEQARKRVAEDERDVLANATSPWIPRLQYAFQDNSSLYLVMELCSGGDLAGLLSRHNQPLAECDAAFYVAEVAHALKALHAMGYVHRDVKPHNIFLDRCGHVKLGDFGSCARLSEGGSAGVGGDVCGAGTADYVAPELLAAADCARRHSVCLPYCRAIVTSAISACDYWSLGVVAFEMVTLKRPFSTGEENSIAEILANIQKYEREPDAQPPFEAPPSAPSAEWRALVAGLLRVSPGRRYNYLDTLQHPALARAHLHSIRDQVPPWVPCVRGAEDATYFHTSPRATPPPSAAPFRARAPFAGQLPFVGYSYIAPEDNEDSTSIGFNASHDCTAIDLATFKSAEKLAVMRGREISSLQSKLAAAEAAASAEAEKTRREAEAEAERTRARLQADITALSLQNRRLERQIEVEKEERMALQRTNQELSSGIAERNSSELRAARALAAELQADKDVLREAVRRLEERAAELQAECARAHADAEAQRVQQNHYKDIIEHARELRHRRLTEINVRPIDSIAKERALRRQTLTGGEAEARELGNKLAAAEASAAREARARVQAEQRLADVDDELGTLRADCTHLQAELAAVQADLTAARESSKETHQIADITTEQLKEAQQQHAQDRVRISSLVAQVQELERALEQAARRGAALEEQSARTEARLHERLRAADARAAHADADEARHREKVNTLEKLVRQLEREVSALENRACAACAARAARDAEGKHADSRSDTESVGDAAHAQLQLLKEQLERAETQLQSRADEIAALRQEARSANLARWRKDREYNDLSVEAKTATRDVKRLEERLTHATEARKTAEQKTTALQNELETLKPQYEQTSKELERLKERFQRLQKAHETAQAEVDRSRNDIRKLKSELQYSEKRRLHSEGQEELGSHERALLRDELHEARAHNTELAQNNKALQEACSMLEEQLTDLEKLADIHEFKSKDLESEMTRLRSELETCRAKLSEAERAAGERGQAATLAGSQADDARDRAAHAECQLELLRERLESREARARSLEARVAALEAELAARAAALGGALRRERDVQEEASAASTRARQHHAHALQLQQSLADAQEELAAAREAAEAAAAWWRTRETKADATLRQQAKLIDFLQAKVEEAGRKKCSLSNKLFGRSGRRSAASPPLRRANRELREEVERLRAQLARNGEDVYPPTPRRAKSTGQKTNTVIARKSIDVPDSAQDNNMVQIVWADGYRERMRARVSDGALSLGAGERPLRARLLAPDARDLPQNDANRAFMVKVDGPAKSSQAAIICCSLEARADMLSKLQAAAGAGAVAAAGYAPQLLGTLAVEPHTAVHLAPGVVAIGCSDGLHSLRGPIRLEWEGDVSPPRVSSGGTSVVCAGVSGARALLTCAGTLAHVSSRALASALRRAACLAPALGLARLRLPDHTRPHLVKATTDISEESTFAVACGRRVFLLRFDAEVTDFKIARSLTVDRPPDSMLLTARVLYIAGEKPLKVMLPSGTLEKFAVDEPIIAAAARKHSPPRAILLIKDNPIEILICYTECGVFVDESGRRTRSEDPKWSSAVRAWEFVNPFLYLVGEDKITILYINEDVYKSPPCTCDSTSLASTSTECFMPEIFNFKVDDPILLGAAPSGIIIRWKEDDDYKISMVEGLAAFRSVGASVESLETMSDSKRSSLDLAQSVTDLSPQNTSRISQESVEATTGFLADIRNRARQLRNKNKNECTSDDIIKEILTTEVGLKHSTKNGRKSPATTSEFDSDSTEADDKPESIKGTNDICAEMFTRQVRFQ